MDFLTVMENKLDEGRMITFEEAVELAKGKIEDEKLFLLADKLWRNREDVRRTASSVPSRGITIQELKK